MGYSHKVEQSNASTSLSEALLFATMCIIGLPVDVQLKDGSVYSGTFHTSSVHHQYGIVLKKARMTKKGKCNGNVVNRGVVETLVILSDDLVQVVAKGVSLPTNHVSGRITIGNGKAPVLAKHIVGDTKKLSKFNKDRKKINQKRQNDGCAHGFTSQMVGKENGGRGLAKNTVDVEHVTLAWIDKSKSEKVPDASAGARQVQDDRLKGEQDNCKPKSNSQLEERVSLDARPHLTNSMEFKLPNGVSHNPSRAFVQPGNQCMERPNSLNAIPSGVSTSCSPAIDATCNSHPNTLAVAGVAPLQSCTEPNKSSKEFKLNPGAKLFSPSFANPTPVTAPVMPNVTSMAYMQSNSPMVAVAGGQSEVGITPLVSCSSAPPKFVQYGNFTAGNGGSGFQSSQPNVGHMANMTHPVRYATQYHPVQAGPTYVNPSSQANVGHMANMTHPVRYATQYHPVQAGPTYVNPRSQAVMIGRFVQQLVYSQPISNDMVQGPATISPVPACPTLTPPVQFPKHQGTSTGPHVPMCVPQPFMANGQQPFVIPNHVPVLQHPFPAIRHIPVPGSNGLYGTKFP